MTTARYMPLYGSRDLPMTEIEGSLRDATKEVEEELRAVKNHVLVDYIEAREDLAPLEALGLANWALEHGPALLERIEWLEAQLAEARS